jgi:vacuolar-type H+-ATPase subunit I/STV1
VHILILIGVGHLVLAAFVLVAGVINRGGSRVDGTRPFVWVWLLASIANGVVGVVQAGIPLLNEIGAFIPIFGVPAVVAWYLSRRHAARLKGYRLPR